MKRRIFWLFLISSGLLLFLNSRFHSSSPSSTLLMKEYKPVLALEKPAITEKTHSYLTPQIAEDSLAKSDFQIHSPSEVSKESGSSVYAKESGTEDSTNRSYPVINEEPMVITGVEYWLAPDQTQVVINLNQSPRSGSYHTFTLEDPPRLVVEFARGKYFQDRETIQVYDKAVKTIRLQRLISGRFQVVFDLVQSRPEFKVSPIEKINDQPDRIMVNISHPKEKEVEFKKPPQMIRNGNRQNYKVVVIDPGHGGSDSGAIGRSGAMEKHIVLNIAKKLKYWLDQTKDIKAYLTRDRDYFLSLGRRTQIAREHDADLFLSIHVNANYDASMNGFSVYCLSEEATDEAAKLLAQRENASDHVGGVVFNQEDPEINKILTEKSIGGESLIRSLAFGELTLDKAIPFLKVRNEGLKRANFAVLRIPSIPSVLVEALYISNPYEEQLLINPIMQDRIAEALYQSVISYFERFRSSRPDKNENEPFLKNPEISSKGLRSNKLFPVRQTTRENKSFVPPSLSGELVSSSSSIAMETGLPTQQSERRIHIVKEGETLWRIANLYKVEVRMLAEINQLKDMMIYTGQKLRIP